MWTNCVPSPRPHRSGLSAGEIRPGFNALGAGLSWEVWWTWSGSNRRPLPCHGSALPTAPQAHLLKGKAAQASLDWSNSRLPVGDSQTLSRKLHLLGDRLCEIAENGYPVDGQATKS